MSTATARKPPPPRRAAPRAPARREVTFEKAPPAESQRIGVYGPGGIGKTSLAAAAPGPVVFFDMDDSLGVLGLDAQRVPGVESWNDLRRALQGGGWDNIRTIVIDSATRAEELAVAWTCRNVPNDKGQTVQRVEDYGYGKGYVHVYDTVMTLVGDLDQHVRAGRNVILVMHDCTANVPNPAGEDYIRYEPRLQSPSSGKASIRLRVREWLDHLLFVGYDVAVQKGKGQGRGTRTIYPVETPACMAKSRLIDEPIPFERGSADVWDALFQTKEEK